jgi:hypothetical protein
MSNKNKKVKWADNVEGNEDVDTVSLNCINIDLYNMTIDNSTIITDKEIPFYNSYSKEDIEWYKSLESAAESRKLTDINDTIDVNNIIDIKEIRYEELQSPINDKLYKQLKQLSRKGSCEKLRLYGNDLIMYAISHSNPSHSNPSHSNPGKVIGMCAISLKSPQTHFANEIDNEIPYLYNYICDKSKKRKQSLALMNYIKNWAKTLGKTQINLDVLDDNIHAQQFFEKNNFHRDGEYINAQNTYIMYTCSIEEIN